MQIEDDQCSLKKPLGRVTERNVASGRGWTEGVVATPYGFVYVYAQGSATDVKHTRLDFCFGGRLYMRNFLKTKYSPRGLVTKAAEFAKEISNVE